MTSPGYSGVPTNLSADIPLWCRKLASAINGLLQGKSNNYGTFTLTANSATSTITDKRIGQDTVIHWQPTTANAATALTNIYESSRTVATSFVLTHTNNAQTDRTFKYTLTG